MMPLLCCHSNALSQYSTLRELKITVRLQHSALQAVTVLSLSTSKEILWHTNSDAIGAHVHVPISVQ